MNIYFSKVIKAGERQREFNFRQLTTSDNNNFNVDVPDDKGQRISFTLVPNSNGQWIPSESKLPTWIEDSVQELNAAIEENINLIPVKKKR